MSHDKNCPLSNFTIPEEKCTCRKGFKTQAEIWQYLLDGGSVKSSFGIYKLNEDMELYEPVSGLKCEVRLDKEYLWHPYHEPKTIKRWVNIYSTGGFHSNHETKEEADEVKCHNRIACVPVTITYTEGEGVMNKKELK